MYPVYKLAVDEFDDATGMFLISMVEDPAMEVEAVLLSKAKPEAVALTLDTHKQYMTSVVIVPDKLIFRNNAKRGSHSVIFTKEDVEAIRNKFFRLTGNLNLSNKNHDQADVVNAQLIESWIVTDSNIDKSVALGMKPQPVGTMMATYHILDKSFWDNEVMTGNITGFSLEGIFDHVAVELSKEPEPQWEDPETAIDNILAQLFANHEVPA